MRPSEFGEQLRLEREGRQTPIERIAEESRVDLCYLEALERGDFDALPGPAFGKLYVRMYADILGFDPRDWLARYDRARQEKRRSGHAAQDRTRRPRRERPVEAAIARWRASRSPPPAEKDDQDEPATEPAQGPPVDATSTRDQEVSAGVASPPDDVTDDPPGAPHPAPGDGPSAPEGPVPELLERAEPVAATRETTPPPASHRRVTARAIAWGVVAASLLGGFVWVTARLVLPEPSPQLSRPSVSSAAREGPAPDPSAGRAATRADPEAASGGERASSTPDARELRASRSIDTSSDEVSSGDAPPGRLSVSEFGLGRGVRDNRLVERSSSFQEGSAAYFLTRVLGGSEGGSVRHVWLREGRVVQTIRLPLGGPHWRTHSRKTLYGLGAWAVEARDDGGRVLARAEFTCVPKR